MRRSELLADDERRRQEAADVENELDIMGGQGGDPAQARALAMRRLGISEEPAAEAGQPYQPNFGEEAEPATGGSGQDGYRAFASKSYMVPDEQEPSMSPLPGRGGMTSSAVSQRPASEPESSGFEMPSLPGGMDSGKTDRVSQALYSAFTRKPLDASFFAQPAQDAMRKEELAQKSSHNDFLKEQLRLKYAEKGGSTDPADADPGSTNSRMYRAYLEGSPAHAGIVAKMKEAGVWEGASKRQLMPTFGEAKQLAPVAGRVYSENQKPVMEGIKHGNRTELQNDRQAYDQDKTVYTTEHADERAKEARILSQNRFDTALDVTKDKMAWAVSQKIPPDAKMIYDAGGRIDSLVGKLGGPGKVTGVGLIVGAVPNSVFEALPEEEKKNVIALRQEIANLVNGYTHKYFGAALSEQEAKRAEAAVPMIKGGRSEAEVLHGVQMLRDALESSTNQALGGAAPEIKARVFRYYSQGGGSADLFGTAQEGATAPTPSPAFNAPVPEIESTEQVEEPSPEQLAGIASSPRPVEVRRPKPQTAPPPRPKAPAPKPAAATSGSKTPGGKPYKTKMVNKQLKKTRYVDANGKVVEEVDGIQ